ncbi:hypothetical protein [Microbacterium sp. NPDC058389]|uniref:hypothetical protein n=1 Tax=Microbacterium sp. NPDC058389 TaxID=3346475 RepID=UPI00364ABE9A
MDARGWTGAMVLAGMMLGLAACQAPGQESAEPLPAVVLPAAGTVMMLRPAWAENMAPDRIEEALQRGAATSDGACDWVAVILSTNLMRQVCRTW